MDTPVKFKRKSKGKQAVIGGKLTPQEAKFVKAYIDPNSPTHLNATTSAEVAYNTTSKDSANQLGNRVIKRERVARTIQERLQDDDLWDNVELGIKSVLADHQHEKYKPRDYAEFLRIVGDFTGARAPEKSVVVSLTPDDRRKEYEELASWLNQAQVEQPARTVEALPVPNKDGE